MRFGAVYQYCTEVNKKYRFGDTDYLCKKSVFFVSRRLPWSPMVMWFKGLCHPVVHPHSFDCWTVGPADRDQVEVWMLLLLAVAASLMGAAGGAYALCRRSSQLHSRGCGWGSGEMMRVAMRLLHKPWLNWEVAGRWNGLSLDVHVVVDGCRETSGHGPTNSETHKETLVLQIKTESPCHLVVAVTLTFVKTISIFHSKLYFIQI